MPTHQVQSILTADPGFLLGDVTRLLRKMFDTRIRSTGLTGAQWRVLVLLLIDDGRTQSQLAAELDMERASVGALVVRLERDGYVVRRPDSDDARLKRVWVQPRARSLSATFEREAHAIYDMALADFSKTEKAALLDLLRRLRTTLLTHAAAEKEAA